MPTSKLTRLGQLPDGGISTDVALELVTNRYEARQPLAGDEWRMLLKLLDDRDGFEERWNAVRDKYELAGVDWDDVESILRFVVGRYENGERLSGEQWRSLVQMMGKATDVDELFRRWNEIKDRYPQ